jgi:phosphoribosylamine---glycine ligase
VNVLVVGSGGREHALCWRLAQDPDVTRVFATPGNAGMAAVADLVPGAGAVDPEAIVDLVEREGIDLTVVGPEAPLVAGLADRLTDRGYAVFGPSAAAARIEGSKAYAKDVMGRCGVPTARAGIFDDVEKAVVFVDELGGRAVVKADGLAAGKGVTVATDRETAAAAIEASLLGGAFGPAGATIVVEELLEGSEISVFALVDGTGACVLLDVAQDHKRVGDGDAGLNTGGMGAYAPVPAVPHDIAEEIVRTCLAPIAAELAPYRGVLFAGLMLTGDGPKVLEYNCRFGDPETQVILPRLADGFAALLEACATDRLAAYAPAMLVHGGIAAVTVVAASGGYPSSYATGVPIDGLDEVELLPGVEVFHAGTALDDEGRLVTAGGRVLAVTGTGTSIHQARDRAYGGIAQIRFEGMHVRTDIAARAAEEER